MVMIFTLRLMVSNGFDTTTGLEWFPQIQSLSERVGNFLGFGFALHRICCCLCLVEVPPITPLAPPILVLGSGALHTPLAPLMLT